MNSKKSHYIYIYKINVKIESKVVTFSFHDIVAVTLDTHMYACTHAYTQTTIITSYHGIHTLHFYAHHKQGLQNFSNVT